MQQIDKRVIRVGIEVDGQLKFYSSPLGISARGTRVANAIQNDAEVKILNLDKDTMDYILTETSPYNANTTQKRIVVEAGRESYGVVQIFSGNIISSTATQPPDLGVVMKCLTGNYKKGEVVSSSQAGSVQLSQVSQQIAQSLQLGLVFQASNTSIANYNYAGAALKQVDSLNTVNGIRAYVDNDDLVVKNINEPLTDTLTVVSLKTGMVGIPELTEQGIKVSFFLDNRTTLGGRIRVESERYPATNGEYNIYKLSFDIASRDRPFFWTAEATRI